MQHRIRAGTYNREDGIHNGVAGGCGNGYIRSIEGQEAGVNEVREHIVRFVIRIQLNILSFFDTVHFVATDSAQITRELVGISCADWFATENIRDDLHNIAVLIPISCFAGKFSGIAVEQPVIHTRAVDINGRCIIDQ